LSLYYFIIYSAFQLLKGVKQNAGKELGYLYEIWVYDNKGKIVEYYK